ncbi:MAG: holin family protein, partial [Tagaea sp.]|nr:holin family protein [Tagaea sp.]
AEVNATARVEAQSEDPYVRRMRPTFGYVMALTWAVQMAAVAWAIVTAPKEAAQVVEALGALSLMWSVGLSVLGVYVYKRSSDKALSAGATPEGAFATLARVLDRKPR